VAQVLPALLGGIFWRGATKMGAAAGVLTGFFVWGYCLFLPSFEGSFLLSENVLHIGPWGISWLRPEALFGIEGIDPLVHAVMWSMALNTIVFCLGSLLSFPAPLERLQGAQFVHVYEYSSGAKGWRGGLAESEDLLVMAQRILGGDQAQGLFQRAAKRQGKPGYLPDPSPDFLVRLERELSGSVGAATAHAMIAQIVGGASVSVEDLMAVADETAQIMEYSSQLEAKTDELGVTARQLRVANEKLTELSIQKDAFLSQISHELRTPMTSIRAFSEILRDGGGLGAEDQSKYSGIIHDETMRLTRLLDDLLDLSVLEAGRVALTKTTANLHGIIDHALMATNTSGDNKGLRISRDVIRENIEIQTDTDRLSQVFINLISNVQKYCDAETPRLRIDVKINPDTVDVNFVDNGTGIPEKSRSLIFEKFSRLSDQTAAGGAGLGLAICREIMVNLGGEIVYLPGQGGAAFRVRLPYP
ncbi:MAG: ATP-binding protein, partial [Pseudoruegeria sp.]